MRFTRFAALFVLFSLVPPVAAQPWSDKLFDGKVTHDFGKVNRGTKVTHSFKITNIYKVTLDITEVSLNCNCMTATPSKRKLEPLETTTLDVVADTTKFTGERTVRISVSVGPKPFVATSHLILTIQSVGGDVVLAPGNIDFGNLTRGQTPSKHLDVEYVGKTPGWKVEEILNSSSSPYDLKLAKLPDDKGPRKGFRIIATMKADAPVGAFKNDVTLRMNDKVNPILVFNILGNVQERLVLTPNQWTVGGKVGAELSKKLSLRGPAPFSITAVDGQGDGLSVEFTKGKQEQHGLTVTFTPTKFGEIKRQLTIKTDLGETAQLTIEADIQP